MKSGLHPPEFYEELWKTILSGEVFHEAFINKRKDGELIYDVRTITPIKDKEGNITHFVSTAKVITEQRHAEEALRKSEANQQMILESINEVVYSTEQVAPNSPNGIVRFVSSQAESIIGYKPNDFIQDPNLWFSLIHPDDVSAVSEHTNTLFATKKTGVRQYRILNKQTGAYQWMEDMVVPRLDNENNVIGTFGVARDITERKRAEQEIIFQKNRFAQLFENSPIAIALLDDQDKVVHINVSFSALFGYYLEEIRGKFLNDLIVPRELKEEAKSYSEQTRVGNQVNKESYRKKKDGALVYVQIVGVPITVNDKTVGIYGMYVDLTQRKDAEKELINAKEKAEEMNKIKSYFFASVSHELRTPFVGIQGYAELLAETLTDPDALEMANEIINSSKRLTDTLNEILSLSKLELEDVEVQKSEVNVNVLLNECYNSFIALAIQKDISFTFVEIDKPIIIKSDEKLLRGILTNLINNAIKYTREPLRAPA